MLTYQSSYLKLRPFKSVLTILVVYSITSSGNSEYNLVNHWMIFSLVFYVPIKLSIIYSIVLLKFISCEKILVEKVSKN